MKRALTACAAVVSLTCLAACAIDDPSTTTPATTAGSVTASTSPAADEEDASPVDGTWRAGPFPLSRVRDALQQAGLAQHLERMDLFPRTELDAELVYDLKIQDGGLLTSISYDGEPLGVIDRQRIEVDGRQVRFVAGDCAETFRWTASETRLTLVLVKDECPEHLGTPDAAYATALYAVAPFARI